MYVAGDQKNYDVLFDHLRCIYFFSLDNVPLIVLKDFFCTHCQSEKITTNWVTFIQC
jgi:hypothetical protein